jgi:hypothetical protein
MQHGATVDRSVADRNEADRSAVPAKAAPLFARLASKLVLEVLPASLASVIGAALLAHYQFGHAAMPAGGVAVATAPASPEMLQLVRDEHDLIRNFLLAQQAAQASRYAKAEAPAAAPSAQDAADTALVVAALRRTANVAPAKAPAPRVNVAAIAPAPAPAPAPQATAPAPAAALVAMAPAAQEPAAVAGLQNSAAPPADPEHRSLVATLLSVKDHVVRAPLHAVMTIGGIPSWLGHRLGSDDEPDRGEQMFSAAS